MGTDRRARQKANRAQRIQVEQRAVQRVQRRNYLLYAVLGLAAVAAVVYLISITGDDDAETATDAGAETTDDAGTDDADGGADTGETTTTEPAEVAEPAVHTPEPGAAIDGAPECPAEDGSSERTTAFGEAPPTCIDPGAGYTATIETNLGTITAELDAEAAPETVNNFVFLARYHYYDGAPFHRIIPGFVIQGGDAVGDPLGTGNPGYEIDEEPPEDGAGYPTGSLAMANAGPGTTGSQFFIVTGPAGEGLPSDYSLFGAVTGGMEVVTEIENLPTTPEDLPTEEIVIESVTIAES